MDRFIVKEPRVGAGFAQGNQMIAFPTNARSAGMMPEKFYYNGGYPPNFHNVQTGNVQNMNDHSVQAQSMMSLPHLGQNSSHLGQNSPQLGHTQPFPNSPEMIPQGHVMSGIDPRYLAHYGDSSSQYILAGQQALNQRNHQMNPFGSNYENKCFVGVDRNKNLTHAIRQPQVMCLGGLEPTKVEEMPKPQPYTVPGTKASKNQQPVQPKFPSSKKPTELDLIRSDCQNQMLMMTRSDKLKALNKSGPRAFSGPVEKVLKWHKTLQEVGVLIIYEIVGKCVSIRPGANSARNLVVRDDNGPAMQIVYYEIDFLLPELKPPCTVRVIGRMMAGTCRLQAFNVRPATGDDVATLPRRAAVAAHHVAKLCKEYGPA